MIKLTELIGRELKLRQPRALQNKYEILDGEAVAAVLSFRSAFGTLATAESAEGAWTFKRVGFFRPRVTVRASDQGPDMAVFKNNTWANGGTLELPDGRRYLADTNFWETRFEFRTDAGEALIRYRNVGGLLHLSSVIEIQRFVAETPWMVLLGSYLIVMMRQDSAAVAAVVATG